MGISSQNFLNQKGLKKIEGLEYNNISCECEQELGIYYGSEDLIPVTSEEVSRAKVVKFKCWYIKQ